MQSYLQFYVSAASHKLLGDGTFQARLPFALVGLGALCLLFVLGRQLRGPPWLPYALPLSACGLDLFHPCRPSGALLHSGRLRHGPSLGPCGPVPSRSRSRQDMAVPCPALPHRLSPLCRQLCELRRHLAGPGRFPPDHGPPRSDEALRGVGGACSHPGRGVLAAPRRVPHGVETRQREHLLGELPPRAVSPGSGLLALGAVRRPRAGRDTRRLVPPSMEALGSGNPDLAGISDPAAGPRDPRTLAAEDAGSLVCGVRPSLPSLCPCPPSGFGDGSNGPAWPLGWRSWPD